MINHHRLSIRLKGYDYAEEGGYFVTIVTHDRASLFGEVVSGEMVLNEFGKIVEFAWHDLINHNQDIELDEFVVMPNHIHGIIHIFESTQPRVREGSKLSPENLPCEFNPTSNRVGHGSLVRAGHGPAPTLPELVRQLKTFSAKRINQIRGTPGMPVWQRNFYDHIIRGEKDYDNIVNYIYANPQNWMKDDENA